MDENPFAVYERIRYGPGASPSRYFRSDLGIIWSLICRVVGAHGAGLPTTTAALSTRCSGSCARALRGAICRRITATGKTRIAAFAAGVTKAYGKRFWSRSWMTPTLHG